MPRKKKPKGERPSGERPSGERPSGDVAPALPPSAGPSAKKVTRQNSMDTRLKAASAERAAAAKKEKAVAAENEAAEKAAAAMAEAAQQVAAEKAAAAERAAASEKAAAAIVASAEKAAADKAAAAEKAAADKAAADKAAAEKRAVSLAAAAEKAAAEKAAAEKAAAAKAAATPNPYPVQPGPTSADRRSSQITRTIEEKKESRLSERGTMLDERSDPRVNEEAPKGQAGYTPRKMSTLEKNAEREYHEALAKAQERKEALAKLLAAPGARVGQQQLAATTKAPEEPNCLVLGFRWLVNCGK